MVGRSVTLPRLQGVQARPPRGRWVLTVFVCSLSLPAQSSIRGWGTSKFDTESRVGAASKVGASLWASVVLKSDGSAYCQGSTANGACDLPPAPAGLHFVDVAIGSYVVVGKLSDGSLVFENSHLGLPYTRVMPSTGTSFTKIVAGSFVAALQSDGSVRTFGFPWSAPPVPPGVQVVDLHAGTVHLVALLSNGTVIAWGDNLYGQCSVPPLPSGITYIAVATGHVHTIALRSDGLVEAFGDNIVGQCQPVPQLPPGVVFSVIAAGQYCSVGWRSDGQMELWGAIGIAPLPALPAGTQVGFGNGHIVAIQASGRVSTWGSNSYYQGYLPELPLGERFMDMSGHGPHTLGTISDGTIVGWGDDSAGLCNAPPLPVGLRYVRSFSSQVHNVATRSDGSMVAWGDNSRGQCNVPPLPGGVRFVHAALSWEHTVALRSDGVAVAFGSNAQGQCSIPSLGNGVTYTDVAAGGGHTALVRSDGALRIVGSVAPSLAAVPALPPGREYVEVATGEDYLVARRNDGTLVTWGNLGQMWVSPPALPQGVSYVEVDAQPVFGLARRSDGEVVAFGKYPSQVPATPFLAPGTSYVQVLASQTAIGRVGPTSTYVSFAGGCAGTRATSRLVPMDTPRIGATHVVHAFELPVDVAVMVFGLAPIWPAPLSLGPLGMPGCTWRVATDALIMIGGQAGVARSLLQIPDAPWLVGMAFYNQAIVMDPGANMFGAVVSDAAVGVIGR